MYLMEKNTLVGKIDENTFELTPAKGINLKSYGVYEPMLKDKNRIKLFLKDRLIKEENDLLPEVLALYGMEQYDLVELAKHSRAMKCTDYWWIATDENKDEKIEDFHILFK